MRNWPTFWPVSIIRVRPYYLPTPLHIWKKKEILPRRKIWAIIKEMKKMGRRLFRVFCASFFFHPCKRGGGAPVQNFWACCFLEYHVLDNLKTNQDLSLLLFGGIAIRLDRVFFFEGQGRCNSCPKSCFPKMFPPSSLEVHSFSPISQFIAPSFLF